MPTDAIAPHPVHPIIVDPATAPPRRPAPWRHAMPILAACLTGCTPRPEPTTFAVPTATAARIRMACPPGTFIGTMTVDCPQPLPRAAATR